MNKLLVEWRNRLSRWKRVVAYYQAGLINALFGYSAYAALIAVGLPAYPAQAIAHVAGVFFNYLTYSRHVFRDRNGSKIRFVTSYLFNYLISVATLYVVKIFVIDDYIAGFITVFAVSVVNYFVLKHLVFKRQISA